MEGEEASQRLTEPLINKHSTQAQPGHASFLNLDWREVKLQTQLAGPLILVNCVQFLLPVISVMIVGHLGELALSSVSLAASFANVTGISLLMGMANALETLCGQAYGARQYHLLGLHMQRAVLILTICSVPITIIWASMEKLLLLLGQDPDISYMAGQYALWLIPSLYISSVLQPLVKFLQAQSIVTPLLLFSAMTLIFHTPLCYLLVYKTGLGHQGAALATCISNCFNTGALLLFVRFSKKCEKTWVPLSWDALHDWKLFMLLAIPSASMVCLEWWCYEILVLLSGILPNPELSTSALSICLNTSALAYVVPAGFSAAVSTRVSNELGAGSPQAAHHALYVSGGLALLEAFIMSSILLSVRNIWGWAFSNEEEVVASVGILMCLLSASTLLENFATILSGVVRGCGRQGLGAYTNLGAFYGVGLPAAILFAFVLHMEAKGLWMGVMCGSFTQFIVYLCTTVATDWEKQAKDAALRLHSCGGQTLLI